MPPAPSPASPNPSAESGTPGKKGNTLLDWLLAKYPDTPKTRARQWISAGRVSVNGQVIRKSHLPVDAQKDSLTLGDRRATTLDLGPGAAGWQIHPRVSLLYLDSAMAIVNKGPGLISVPASNADLSALSILADFLAGKLKALERGVAGKTLPPAYRKLIPLPVHRLDQYTTGVFCIAMNPKARGHLIEQLKAHTMQREYVAYVAGRTPTPKGTWRNWLQLTKDGLRQHIITPAQAKIAGDEACEAITHYEVIAEYPGAGAKTFHTKLRLRLETGRKHQIRAQAAHAGLPLIGDRTYNPAYRHQNPDARPIEFPRQALHAEVLKLEHPEQPGARMAWTGPLPKDLRQLENNLRSGKIQANHVG